MFLCFRLTELVPSTCRSGSLDSSSLATMCRKLSTKGLMLWEWHAISSWSRASMAITTFLHTAISFTLMTQELFNTCKFTETLLRRGLSRDTQTLPNPLPPNVLTEQFFEALLYLKTEAAKGGDERLVLNRGRCSRCVSIKIHKKSGSLSGWKCLCTEHIIAWCNFTAAPPGRRRLALQTRACKHVALLGDERSGKGAWMPCRR